MIKIRLLLVACVVSVLPVLGGLPECDGISQASNTTLTAVEVASGLTGDPLLVVAPPGDRTRIFIVSQHGDIHVLERGAAPTAATLYLALPDTAGGEGGLLGLAFHPDFATNHTIYVYASGDGLFDYYRFVREYRVIPGNTNAQHVATGRTILSVASGSGNHNGGMIAFGSDNYLYIAIGDGGGGPVAGSTCYPSQDLPNLWGKMLRIDVLGISGGTPPECADYGDYSVPLDNPLRSIDGACDEVWAYGLRNPWRWSFDSQNDDLYIGDVGSGAWEEVDYVPGSSGGGENYGWTMMEGNHCLAPPVGCTPPAPPCNDPSLTDPVLEISHEEGVCSVIGGFVYRGCRMPNFDGTYFYGDYCDGLVRTFKMVNGAVTNQQTWPALDHDFGLTSFGIDAEGEVYFTDVTAGAGADRVLKIVPPLSTMEVSGVNAIELLLSRDGSWTWEDLHYSSWHPIAGYRVWRSGPPNGLFQCIHSSASPSWPAGGDPNLPQPGALYFYVVTAVNGSGEATLPGGNPPHALSAAPCPYQL